MAFLRTLSLKSLFFYYNCLIGEKWWWNVCGDRDHSFFSLGSFKVSGLSVFTTENMGAGFVKLKTQ